MTLLSIVLPVYNEEHNVRRAYTEISEVFETLPDVHIEFIFADNHSTDGTFAELRRLAAEDSRVRVLRYARNFGFNRSLLTAYRHAKGAAAKETGNGSVPVILITYATSEDAVRKALAAVGRDRVISGRPQVIRIEKN